MSIYLFLDSKRDEEFRTADRITAASGQRYEVVDRIDCGGNAVVHRCVETITGDDYAVKFQLVTSQKRLQRFKREIELNKGSKHDQLIGYVDHGQVVASRVCGRGRSRREMQVELLFVIMALAESNLKKLVQKRRTALPYEDYIGQFKGLARALGVLHEKAVHRDIKPENILIKGETWLLSDFGLCEIFEGGDDITGVDEPIGPRYWMSPEAINRAIGNNDEISKRSDVFQLCSVFWFVVTGRHPSGSVSSSDWNGSDGLYSVLVDALSHNEARRPADGVELARRLDDATLPAIA
jgi:serine/threonine-protein kinase